MGPRRLAVGVAEPCELRQRAVAVRSERLEALNAGAIGQRGEHVSLARRHDGEARTRVAQQVLELVGRAGGGDPHKNPTPAPASGTQQHGFRRLFHPSPDPIAPPPPPTPQGTRGGGARARRPRPTGRNRSRTGLATPPPPPWGP